MKIVEGCVKKKVEIEADWFELSLAQPNDSPYHYHSELEWDFCAG